jgi:fructose-1,6-bisphosphatase I
MPATLGHFLEHELGATAEQQALVNSISQGIRWISDLLRGARLRGHTERTNVHGETVHKIDIAANELLIEALTDSPALALVSEELTDIHHFSGSTGQHLVVADPLDGSSNLDAGIPTGTIFGAFHKASNEGPVTVDDFLHQACALDLAGYALYSSATTLVLTVGPKPGVHAFTLDPVSGEFHLTLRDIRCPEFGSTYSINEGNFSSFDPGVRAWCRSMKASPESKPTYSLRYVGSLVADAHRTLLKGGIFAYPPTAGHPEGKLRFLYEALPMARLFEAAGGTATTGRARLLHETPTALHARVPLVLGSRRNIEDYEVSSAR